MGPPGHLSCAILAKQILGLRSEFIFVAIKKSNARSYIEHELLLRICHSVRFGHKTKLKEKQNLLFAYIPEINVFTQSEIQYFYLKYTV